MRIVLIMAAAGALLASPAPAADPSRDSVSLAKEIVELSHRQTLTRDTYAKQLHATMTFCKDDQKCQADLDRAIMRAAAEISEKYAGSMTQILARKLAVPQLQATLKFYKSADGQAITAAESQWSDEMAQIGLATQATARRVISESFCPSHPDVCVNDLGRRASLPPKS
jgi:hypothetical protein